jgi:hypothetical protein
VELVLHDGGWQEGEREPIEWWEKVEIDNDGLTPYATKEDVETLAMAVQARSIELWGKSKK